MYIYSKVASKATSPEEEQALRDGADSMVSNIPVYQGVTTNKLMARHAGMDKLVAKTVCTFLDGGKAEAGAKAFVSTTWPGATLDTRCEIPLADGSYPDKLAYSAGKGGERRMHNDIEKTYLRRHIEELWRPGAPNPGDRVGSTQEVELAHLVDMLNADLTSISLLPPPLEVRFQQGQLEMLSTPTRWRQDWRWWCKRI